MARRRPRARASRRPRRYAGCAVPALGGLVAGLVLALGSRCVGAARGWDILEAVVLRNGVLPLRSTLVRAASSLVTQASAGAVGREGPIVLWPRPRRRALGRALGAPTRERRILVGCGIAAGLACAYNTPLGAALFTMEIIFGSFALEAFAPLAVASADGHAADAGRLRPRSRVPRARRSRCRARGRSRSTRALGLLGGVVAAAFLFALRASAALFTRAAAGPRPLAMALAGLVARRSSPCAIPRSSGTGARRSRRCSSGPGRPGTCWPCSLLRLVVTPLAVGSGTVGGVFTPTLFIGAMLGHAFGVGVQARCCPGLGGRPVGVRPRRHGLPARRHDARAADVGGDGLRDDARLRGRRAAPARRGAGQPGRATRFSQASVYTEALRRKAGDARRCRGVARRAAGRRPAARPSR